MKTIFHFSIFVLLHILAGNSVLAQSANFFGSPPTPIQPKTDYYYRINSGVSSNQDVTVAGANTAQGTNIYIYAREDQDAQYFRFNPVGNNYYEIVSKLDDKMVLDVQGGNTELKTNIQLWPRNDTKSQHFRILKDVSGRIYIESALKTGMVLDVQDAKSANRTNIQLYQIHKGKNQWFKLIQSGYLTAFETRKVPTQIPANRQYTLHPYVNTQWGVASDNKLTIGGYVMFKKNETLPLTFKYLANDIYQISSVKGCVAVYNDTKYNRKILQLEPCEDKKSQKFRLRIYNLNGNDYLDLESMWFRGESWDVNDLMIGGGFRVDQGALGISPRKGTDRQRFLMKRYK